MDQTLLQTAIGVPMIAGLTQVFQKAFSVSANMTPLLSLVIGIILGAAVFFTVPGLSLITVGVGAIVSSLAANGLYDHAASVAVGLSAGSKQVAG